MKSDLASIALEERFLLQKEYLGDNKLVNQVLPLVSVTVATYQHVNYIRQCLEGILMQKTNFPYEIIVGEDGSVDGTQDICKEYAEKYPDRIRLFIRDRNLSQFVAENGKVTRFNGIWNRMSARGKYIAWCEGDDYWIDPLKLQKQVDFLESHPDYGLIYTQAKVLQGKKYVQIVGSEVKDFRDLLLGGNRIPTLTTCFVRELQKEYIYQVVEKWHKAWKMGDYPLWLFLSHRTKIKYLEDVTSVYRMLPESASHSKNITKMVQFSESIYDIRLFFLEHFYNGEDVELIKRRILEDKVWGIFRYYFVLDEERQAFEYLRCNKNDVYGKRRIVGFLMKYSSLIKNILKNKWVKQM